MRFKVIYYGSLFTFALWNVFFTHATGHVVLMLLNGLFAIYYALQVIDAIFGNMTNKVKQEYDASYLAGTRYRADIVNYIDAYDAGEVLCVPVVKIDRIIYNVYEDLRRDRIRPESFDTKNGIVLDCHNVDFKDRHPVGTSLTVMYTGSGFVEWYNS